jgi:flagellar protein FlgJ
MITNASNSLASDPTALASLRTQAGADPKAATREAAKQFEAIFMQELLKNMRSSTQATGMLDNSGTQLGTEMLDSQYAKQLSGQPGGLADVIARQIERQMGVASPEAKANAAAITAWNPKRLSASTLGGADASSSTATVQRTPLRPPANAQEFVDRVTGDAKAAEAATGIPAAFMISQAALETGWGKKEIKMADGSNSFNLFGIKAGGSWKGPTTEITTTEFVNGQAQKVKASFRAYSSYEEAFNDYAKLMKDSPRYQNVVAVASNGSAHGFAQNLQKAGYATDPQYAEKLGRVINTTLRLQRAST